MKKIPYHPFLVSIFPILSLYNVNRNFVSLSEILVPLFLSFLVSFIFYLFFSNLFRESEKGAILTTFIFMLFFSFNPLEQKLSSVFSDNFLPLTLTFSLLFVFALLAFLVFSRINLLSTNKFLNYFSLVVFIIPAFSIMFFEIQSLTGQGIIDENIPLINIDSEQSDKPDIYYFILDGYARGDILEKYYGYNNSEFLNSIENRGFSVLDGATSNYSETKYSLSSSLNMQYHGKGDIEKILNNNKDYFYSNINNSKVDRYLKNIGYKTVGGTTTWIGNEHRKTDIYLGTKQQQATFFTLLISNTPIGYFFENNINSLRISGIQRGFLKTFEEVERIPDIKGPTFSYLHVLSPHFPHVFSADGRTRENVYVKNDRDEDVLYASNFVNLRRMYPELYKKTYAGQLAFVNKTMIRAIDLIIEKNDNSIIIIQSDHGPLSMFYPESLENSNLEERFSILSAVRLPPGYDIEFENDSSSVNTFRTLFNGLFGEEYEILDNKAFFIEHYNSVGNKPKEIVEVSEQLFSQVN